MIVFITSVFIQTVDILDLLVVVKSCFKDGILHLSRAHDLL